MKATKANLKKIIIENFDVDIDTFTFTKDYDEINVKSKYERINASIYVDAEDWEDGVISHINWQLGIKKN